MLVMSAYVAAVVDPETLRKFVCVAAVLFLVISPLNAPVVAERAASVVAPRIVFVPEAWPMFRAVLAAPKALTVVLTVLNTVAVAGPTIVPGMVTLLEASRYTALLDG